jgi:hypothetical protein
VQANGLSLSVGDYDSHPSVDFVFFWQLEISLLPKEINKNLQLVKLQFV